MKSEKEANAFGMTYDEFCILDEKCGGFNSQFYKNHQLHNEGESFLAFTKKGSESLKTNPIIQGKLC